MGCCKLLCNSFSPGCYGYHTVFLNIAKCHLSLKIQDLLMLQKSGWSLCFYQEFWGGHSALQPDQKLLLLLLPLQLRQHTTLLRSSLRQTEVKMKTNPLSMVYISIISVLWIWHFRFFNWWMNLRVFIAVEISSLCSFLSSFINFFLFEFSIQH